MESYSQSRSYDSQSRIETADVTSTFKTGIDFFPSYTDSGNNISSTPHLLNKNEIKLPTLVNFVALRETVLSEAPFVSRTNRSYWKKWIDSQQYVNMVASSLSFVGDCIAENGTVSMQRLRDIEHSEAMQKMALNLADMAVAARGKFHGSADQLFLKLPELLCYMIVNALQYCAPKHGRLYNSVRFREILLDWLCELIGGFRLTRNRGKDKDWLFADAQDISIVVLRDADESIMTKSFPSRIRNSVHLAEATAVATGAAAATAGMFGNFPVHGASSASRLLGLTGASAASSAGGGGGVGDYGMNGMRHSTSMGGATRPIESTEVSMTGKNNKNNNNNAGAEVHDKKLSAAISSCSIENSPLISMYFKVGRSMNDTTPAYQCAHTVRARLSSLPDRPVFSIRKESVLIPGQHRLKKINHESVKRSLAEVAARRKAILKAHGEQRQEMLRDLGAIRHSHRMQMSLLRGQQGNNNNSNDNNNNHGSAAVSQKLLLAAAAAKEGATFTENSVGERGTSGTSGTAIVGEEEGGGGGGGGAETGGSGSGDAKNSITGGDF